MTTTKTAASSKADPKKLDAIALLKADHEAVSDLFAEYEKSRSVPKKKALVAQMPAAKVDQQAGGQGTLHDKTRIELLILSIGPVIMDAVSVEGQG